MRLIVINLVFILVIPLLFAGVINRVKSFWAGRQGPSLFQPWYDFFKLLRKGAVISHVTSSVFSWTPVLSLVAVFTAALLTPLAAGKSIMSFSGDFILFAYLLALAKFFSLSAALDTGSSFEGMGASREATFSALIEPAFFILLGTCTIVSGNFGLAGVHALVSGSSATNLLAAVISASALLIMLLTEGCRVPVDDPNTHLELTMIHEVMVLDNSGPDMALIHYTANLKMFIISAIMANFVIPTTWPPLLMALTFTSLILLTAIFVGCVESLMARLRMNHVPQFLFFMTSLALTVFCLIFLVMSGGLK
jgi:formate hydrogenlyase subunit 4